METKSEMVVCNIYKLFRNGNSFTQEGKRLERSGIAIPREYVEDQNHNWKDSGMWHEIDEEKTSEFYELREKERLVKIKNSKISKEVAKNLADMLDINVNGYENVDVEEKKEVKKSVYEPKVKKPNQKERMKGIGDLKLAYLAKFGTNVPINKSKDIDWILDKVNNGEVNK